MESRVKTKEEIEEIKKDKILTILLPIKRDVDNINKISFENLGSKIESYSYKIKFLDIGNKNDVYKQTVSINADQLLPKVQNEELALCTDFESLFKKSSTYAKFEYEYLANNIMAEKELHLKIGTHVMCIANIDMQSENQLANGSQGIVVGFRGELPMVKFNNIDQPIIVGYYTWKSENNDKIAVAQIPLIYAWAITIHKAQGVTMQAALIDIGSNIFEYGQSYVALSRVKNLDGIYLSKLNYNKINANPKVKAFYGD